MSSQNFLKNKSVVDIFTLVLAILRAIPPVNKWIEQFFVFYANKQIDRMEEENRIGLKKALHEFDQRELEKALGNKAPGEPSGNAGAVIVDELPGVR